MKIKNIAILLFLPHFFLMAQKTDRIDYNYSNQERILLSVDQYIQLPPKLQSKILSGTLLEKISTKNLLLESKLISASESFSKVILYFEKEPTETQKSILESEGIECYWELWTPSSYNHPLGFIVANLPVEKFIKTLSLEFIKKMDTAEQQSYPHNNNGVQSINAPQVWNMGYDGSGVTIGILDSGLDDYYKGTDLPSNYQAMDYGFYPSIDPGVSNTVSGHGTHVTGSALGRGTLSNGHSHPNNGEGAFTGTAPGADLVFLKIGKDETSSASSDAMIAAMDAAVDIYNVDILSMSYGGWDAFHDGSIAKDQKADWVYDQGVPFFISAGNSADDNRHYSGTVAANSSSGFIQVNVSDPGDNQVALWFNLVWYDGLSTRNDLTLEYYDASYNQMSNIIMDPFPTESLRGTESLYSHYNYYITAAGSYYLKVVNNSPNSQKFHIYDDWGSYVTFQSPDMDYTVGSPGCADNAFTVGAYVSRETWTDSNGDSWHYNNYVLDDIAPFSSRGPRVDGYQKPSFTAPGHVVLSLRDTDVYTSFSNSWIDNDGIPGGAANYYRMQGTSMACPIAAGAGALLLQKNPSLTPGQIYTALISNTNTTGLGQVPNSIWGYGKLDIYQAVLNSGASALVDVDVQYLSIEDGPNHIGTASFVLSNIGGALLNFDITVEGNFSGYKIINDCYTISGISNRNQQNNQKNFLSEIITNKTTPKSVVNNRINQLRTLTGDNLLVLDDGNDSPETFIGWGDATDFQWRNEFDVPGTGFELDALNFFMRTETYSTNSVYVEITDAALNVLASGILDLSLSQNGKWYRATINPPINFDSGEKFFISIETVGSGINFPAGADKNGLIQNKSYYFNGATWINLNTLPGYENGAFLIRAEGDIGSTVDRITVSPESGSINPGSSRVIEITFNSEGLDDNVYEGEVHITTNGGNLDIPIDFIVDVENLSLLPKEYSLEQNYPNPFNPNTTIDYSIPKSGDVKLTVFDVMGREVKILINRHQNAGIYSVQFNANELSSGIYLYRLTSGEFSLVRKLILLK